jgi:hypothetical protein
LNTEELVRIHATKRPGFELISYRTVALPIFRIRLKVLEMAKKELPPIPEFVLKAVKLGFNRPDDVSAFLGVDERTVTDGIHKLIQSDDLMLSAPENERVHRLMITQKGEETLFTSNYVRPEEKIHQIDVDGMTRRVIDLEDLEPTTGRKISTLGLLELAPNPRQAPDIPEIKEGFGKWYKDNYGQEGNNLIDVISIEDVDRLFRDDVLALCFKAIDGDEVRLAFLVGRALSEEHEIAFARAERASQLSLVPHQVEDARSKVAQILGNDVFSKASPPADVNRLNSKLDSVNKEFLQLSNRFDTAESLSEKSQLKNEIISLQEQLANVKAEREAIVVRHLEVFEHRAFLGDTLRSSTERIMIISPWIKRYVVDDNFMRLLTQLLKSGVTIYIGYGMPKTGPYEEQHRDTIIQMESLSKKHPNFTFAHLGTHAKVLICDHRYCICSSFNWLSFLGDPDKTFRDERGTYVALPEVVDSLHDEYLQLFNRKAPTT